MRNKIFKIFACFSVSVSVVVTLYVLSIEVNENGFIRLFPPHILGERHELDLGYNSYYISGLTSQHIFLGNVTAAALAIEVNYELSDSIHLNLPVPRNKKLNWSAVQIEIDSPNIYMTEHTSRYFASATLSSKIPQHYDFDSLQFDLAAAISANSILVRSFSLKLNQNILKKINITPSGATQRQFILEKQIDGTFSTDGQLRYSRELSSAFYMYYYRNQFLVLDSNLNLKYKGKTIDTIQHAQIKVATINYSNRIHTSLSSPPKIVNKKGCISNGWIFVNSALLADNESKKLFDQSSVIDVYSLNDGKYHFSFYLPDHHNIKMKDFAVYDKRIVAMYDQYILTFELEFPKKSERKL